MSYCPEEPLLQGEIVGSRAQLSIPSRQPPAGLTYLERLLPIQPPSPGGGWSGDQEGLVCGANSSKKKTRQAECGSTTLGERQTTSNQGILTKIIGNHEQTISRSQLTVDKCRSPPADQEKFLALLAPWSVHQKPTAKCEIFSIEKILSITKTGSKRSLSVLKQS